MEVLMRRKPRVTYNVRVLANQSGTPWLWISLGLVALALLSLGVAACGTAPAQVAEASAEVPAEISIGEAHQMYEEGVFFLDVRTQEEWDEFHAPNSTLIPLDQLESRLGELPDDEQIVVVCRSGNRSQVGRDTLLKNGFNQVTSMAGGLNAWRSAGYPVEQ
jgi:rhodanese-related sulfurtransferase